MERPVFENTSSVPHERAVQLVKKQNNLLIVRTSLVNDHRIYLYSLNIGCTYQRILQHCSTAPLFSSCKEMFSPFPGILRGLYLCESNCRQANEYFHGGSPRNDSTKNTLMVQKNDNIYTPPNQ